jgi:anti-sigma regulatory factor (Ser/Thr protein kinase)
MSATGERVCTAHSALLYAGPSRFVDTVAGFVLDGLEAGDRVMAAVSEEKFGWVCEQLGEDARAVDFAAADAMYERHGPMFRAMLDYIERHRADGPGRVRILAEPPLEARGPIDAQAYMRYEAAFNVANGGDDARVLCAYDTDRLPAEIIDAARRTHPHVLEDGRVEPSPAFMDPRAFVRQGVRDRAAPAGVAAFALEAPEDIATARAIVRAHAEVAGLSGPALEDLMVVVSEVATNALVHGRAPRALWSYLDDGHLVCQVQDGGSGLPDPLVGYLPPDLERLGGRGLWLAHQLCDIVEVASDATHTTVLLHTKLPAAA